MEKDVNNLPKRKNPRLEGFDYNTPGTRFITICTHQRRQFLSKVVGDLPDHDTFGSMEEMPSVVLTEQGQIVDRIIRNLPSRLGVEIEQYIIMPNHIHMIVIVPELMRAIRESPLQKKRSDLSKAIGYIKMNASKEIRARFGYQRIWQRNFHDHIIRNPQDHEAIAHYILTNPQKWQFDCFCKEGL
ncbi:MAG: hypothetical protein IJX82_02045 [Clostridia bacterium]|nr:hypothetical protein [Clostridia bacterium]